jgi:hypothetical protein
MSEWQVLKVDPVTGVRTEMIYEPSTSNPEIGTMRVREVMPAHVVNSILTETHHLRSEFRGYKEDFTPTARIPENLYWHLRKKSGEQDGMYDQKYFQKLLKNDYSEFRTDKGGKVV